MKDAELQHYLEMLKSSDPAQRRQAIIVLGKSGDKRALKPLSNLYKTDPDEALRQLALKAGRHIQKTTTASVPEVDSISYDIAESTAPPKDEVPNWMRQMEEQAPKKPKKVTAQDRSASNRLKERAMNAAVSGKMDEVVEFIAEAIEINPEMEKDGMLLGLLGQATGMNPETALAEVKRLNAEDRAAGKKRRSSGGESWDETINFVLELAIWVIIIGLFGAVSLFLTINDEFWQDQEAAATSQEEVNFLQDGQEFWEEYGILAALAFGAAYGLGVVGVSLFMSFIAWFVGFNFLEGRGLLYPFLTAMIRVVIAVLFISTTAGFLGQYFSPTSDIGIILSLSPLVLGIGITAWTIGRVHEFGIAMGCVNMVGTLIACGVMNCACSMLFTFGNL